MKKNKIVLLPLAIASFALAGCGPKVDDEVVIIHGSENYETQYLEISSLNIALNVGEKKEIAIESLPQKIAESGLLFQSKDESVAKVNEAGVIEGVGVGYTQVTVKTKSGENETPVNVYVTAPFESGKALETLNNIKGAYETHVQPTKFRELEYSAELYYKNGVLNHGYKTMEIIDYDEEAGYFMVTSDDIYIKSENGAPEKNSGKWIFSVLNENAVRMYHISKTGKTFIDMTLSNRILESENPRKEAIFSILDMFFVSGSEIVTDQTGYMDGSKNFAMLYNSFEEDPEGFTQFGENSFFYHEVDSWKNQNTAAYDEILHNGEIPAGTLTNDYQYIDNFYVGTSCPGINIDVVSNYTLGGEKMSREYVRNMVFLNDFEKEEYEDPKEEGFTEVFKIYDL